MKTETENWAKERADGWLHSAEHPNFNGDAEEARRCHEICGLITAENYEQAVALILADHLTYS